MEIRGVIEWEISEAGLLVRKGACRNLVTEIGEQMYGDRGAGIAGAPAAPTGMKLGTGNTAPAKTGAGAALVAYLADSDQAFEATFPSSSVVGGKRRVAYKCEWDAGKATSPGPITELVLINDALADAASAAGATIARALLAGVPLKSADQVLTVTWYHDLLGT